MTNEETNKYNKIIQEFCGWKLVTTESGQSYYFIKHNDEMQTWSGYDSWCPDGNSTIPYHVDWHFLLDDAIGEIERYPYLVIISYNECIIRGLGKEKDFEIREVGFSKKEAVYLAVIKFINWYNENKKVIAIPTAEGHSVSGDDMHWTVNCPTCENKLEYTGFFDKGDINECKKCGCKFTTSKIWMDETESSFFE